MTWEAFFLRVIGPFGDSVAMEPHDIGMILLAGFVVACSGPPVRPETHFAQAGGEPRGPQGTLSGVVVDGSTGDPLENVVVAVHGQSTQSAREGTFELKLSGGIYRAIFWKRMFETIAAENIKVEVGVNTRIRVVLIAGDDDVEMLGDAIAPPVLLSGPNPPTGIGYGELVIRCTITTEGNVRDCRPKQGQPTIPEVIRALQARKYRPALRHGQPVEVSYTFRLHYR